MKFLFDDDTFSFETLRTTGLAYYFGADLGVVLATARCISRTPGNRARLAQRAHSRRPERLSGNRP